MILASLPVNLSTLSTAELRRMRLKLRARLLSDQNKRTTTPEETRQAFDHLSDAVADELSRRQGEK